MLSILISLFIPAAYGAAPFIAAEISPLSRGDLSWIAEAQGSGLLVGEFDGFVNPAVKTHIGAWLNPQLAVSLNLGTARLQTTTWADEVFVQQHWGVFRPGFDLRFSPWRTPPKLPKAWLMMGAYLDLASSRDSSNGYTESEQEEASGIATGYANRLRGQGGRLGFGVEQRLIGGLSLGLMATTFWHRSAVITESSQAVSSWTSGDASLLVSFDWPSPTLETSNNDLSGQLVEFGEEPAKNSTTSSPESDD
jgi:hypothetical protein